jgi:hypothetical protein
MVSAAGFEPATHALKGEHFESLPRGFNHLPSANTFQIGAKPSQSALNLQLNLQWIAVHLAALSEADSESGFFARPHVP